MTKTVDMHTMKDIYNNLRHKEALQSYPEPWSKRDEMSSQFYVKLYSLLECDVELDHPLYCLNGKS